MCKASLGQKGAGEAEEPLACARGIRQSRDVHLGKRPASREKTTVRTEAVTEGRGGRASAHGRPRPQCWAGGTCPGQHGLRWKEAFVSKAEQASHGLSCLSEKMR